jgi:hypothetical protein
LAAARPGIKLPAVSPEAAAFARTGEPSYAGITEETYVGADRREPGTVTLEGDWQTGRQYVELRKGTGRIILPFTAGEVNLVVQPGSPGRAAMAVLLDGKPVGEARGADVGPDGVAHFDRSGMIRLVAGAPRGKHADPDRERCRHAGVRVHLRPRWVGRRPLRRAVATARAPNPPTVSIAYGTAPGAK